MAKGGQFGPIHIIATASLETHFMFNALEITVVHYLIDVSLLMLNEYGKELNVYLQFDKH